MVGRSLPPSASRAVAPTAATLDAAHAPMEATALGTSVVVALDARTPFQECVPGVDEGGFNCTRPGLHLAGAKAPLELQRKAMGSSSSDCMWTAAKD
jgi:hypothetical protein